MELRLINAEGVQLVPLEIVLTELCHGKPGAITVSAGGDLVDLIEFYAKHHAQTLAPSIGKEAG